MLHLPQAGASAQLGSVYKKNLNLVTVRRDAWSYFTYSEQDELNKQRNLKQAALCQVYEDFTEMSIMSKLPTRICLVGEAGRDAGTVQAAESFGMPVIQSQTGLDIINDTEWRTFYVLQDFEDEIFDAIHKQKECILGPPALKYAAEMKQTLGQNTRPIYNYAMRGVVTCFTGIRKKDELTKLVNLIHSMGGCIKKDLNTKTTHLICNHSGGEKYQYAKTFRLTVVRPAWVYAAWSARDSQEFEATQDSFTKTHRLRAFEGQKICFFGFPAEEHQHMVDVLLENGGVCAELDDPECSHVVVDHDNAASKPKPEPKNHNTHILKSDWFWYTIQNGYANEMDFLFGDYLDSITNTPSTDRRDSLPISFNKRKRKRFSQRIQLEGTPLGSGKRRSSVSDAGLLSVSNSFFDCTTSPDKLENDKLLHAEPEASEATPTKKSMRFNHFMDFFTTESNYVGILDTILNLFKNKLEELAETNDPLLNKSEIKSIFGNFLPIHEVHQSMLEHLRKLHANWREDCLIGDIIIQHRDELIKAYPPYVNFYEQMKEQLLYCDREYPRFHAFLKINQTKPECGRQSLQDLMIRPVQRLPSISLLLKDILKHTGNANVDHASLEEALKAIKQVTLHINEDKRRTESRMAIFDIFNDIDGCPAHLVSSNRSFISKCEVNELSDSLSGRGDSLLLYLFSDSIELCKKRSRGFNTAKSPSTAKTHKHIKLISLNTIRFVIDITDSPRAFGLLQRGEKEKLYTFSIIDEETDKLVYLKKLCMQIAAHTCRTDADKMLLSRTSLELEVDISDVNVSTLSKAFKLAAKTRLKVGRAFSFNKTPNKLKRAVSTMMTSPFGSTNSLTPASQLAQMRLASCTNINEVADEDCSSMRSNSPSAQSEMLVVPPLSVQPTRKNKAVVGRI
ncbi:protein ECT2 isoform X4 [Drosophila sulfurigaster albostrigata]|uniref:protein ECT2 isoform X4 n=1 Tax=Drosophila sulfurigaster albostrigata TaxID=89887 RepID=UPI002D21CD62|nr:protein ECT2 isoform X4 [Drosophila sulfurigaster albostrigata]